MYVKVLTFELSVEDQTDDGFAAFTKKLATKSACRSFESLGFLMAIWCAPATKQS